MAAALASASSRASGRAASGAFAGPRAPAAPPGGRPLPWLSSSSRARAVRSSSSRRARRALARPALEPHPPPRSGARLTRRGASDHFFSPRGRVPRARASSSSSRAAPEASAGPSGSSPPGSPGPSSRGSSSDGVIIPRPPGTSTTGQAMANSVNILLGVGLLSVPYALARGGWAGLGVLFLLGGVTNYTGKALVRCQDLGTLEVRDGEALPESFRSGDEDEEDWLRVNASESLSSASRPARRRQLSSYEDIGEAAFGRAGRTFITAVLYTELVGTCALFFILEGDHLALLFSGSGRDSAWFQAASACVMVPTLWLADLGALSYVGALGAAASVSLAGVVGYDLWMGTQGFTALPPGLADTSVLHASTLPVSFGLLAFVFAGHAVFPAIYASMETPEEYEPMLDATYAIVFATCLVIGGAGYALYGDAVRDEVTLNLPNGALSTLALALITINPLSKFALTMDPVARGLESVAGVDIRDAEGDGPLVARVLRTGLGMGSLLIAAKVPFFAVVMSLIGSFLTLTVSVVFPSACYLKMFGGRMSDAERVGNVGVILLGAFCAVAGSADAVAQITGKVAGG